MMRQGVHAHLLLAPRAPRSAGRVRRAVAVRLRPALAPIAALAAALAGLVFVILLPICGVASVLQGAASAAWDLARRLARRPGGDDTRD